MGKRIKRVGLQYCKAYRFSYGNLFTFAVVRCEGRVGCGLGMD